ncbi:MAG TPA: ribonuclease Z [Deltaproteobacteria bacterium]|nr:ribonuclease Z [Deltaproteobacteria bacterium]HQI80477.1 ribonuclease Z [Deltaproteobacteria bacterium]
MSDRKLIILGTASQVPGRTRNQNGYMVRFDHEGLLFDPGEGTQRQMIRAGVSVSEVTRIFITHFHGDHCLGLAGLIQRISLDRVPHEIEIYYPASGQVFYEHLRDSCLFYNTARLRECPVGCSGGVVFEDERMVIEAQPLEHIVECFGYRVQEKDTYTLDPARLAHAGIRPRDAGRLKSSGWMEVNGRTVRLEDVGRVLRGQCFAFIMDTRECVQAYELARGADLCVMESTYLSDMEEAAREYCHLTASQAARMAHEAGVKKLVLTHYSQRYSDLEGFVREASEHHSDVVLAVDGETIWFPKRRRDTP